MTAASPAAPHVHERSSHTPTFGSLLRAELLRIYLRRFARGCVLVLIGLLVLVAGLEIHAAGKADAIPLGAHDLVDQLYAVGIAIAVLGFVFGCTLGGADWSNRTMPALLFWEPRRLRLFATKVVALGVAMFAFLVVASVVWLTFYAFLIGANGSFDDADGLAGDLLVALVRCVVLVVVAALLGFGLANLTRNTGAALGVAFVYFVILQTAILILLPWVDRWTLNANVGALFTDGGIDYESANGHMVHISAFVGGLTLITYAVVLCGVAAELFRRRDVT